MTTKLKRKLLASQLTQKINEQKEEQLRLAVSNFFRKQMNLVLAAFDEYYNDTLLLQGHINLILAPVHEMTREYYEMLLEHNTGMFRRGEAQAERLVENARQQYSMKAAKPVQFLHDNENKYTQHFGTLQFSEDHLTNYTFTASDKTMNRVDSEINKILTDGYREGWGVRDVRNRIMERYGQFSSWEANRIARTEMQTAHNMGMMNKYQGMGVDYIEWRSAHDRRTRRSHALLDGEIVKVGDRFSNGLMFPGDKSGKIEEWINCRCSAVPYLMSPGTSAPVGQSQFREENLVSVSEPNYGDLLKKETGGALNWQQYKQILHGKPLEQVLAGVTVAEAKQQQKEEPKPKPVENAPYQLNNRENSYSSVVIEEKHLKPIIDFQLKRAKNKIEYGNCMYLDDATMYHQKDVRGKAHGVVCRRPNSSKDFAFIHNHPGTSNATFSGADMRNQLEHSKQRIAIATTPDGIWIARDTDWGMTTTHTDDHISKVMYGMNGKVNEFAKPIYEEKYKELMQSATDKKEFNKLKEEYRNEYIAKYNEWVLDTYGVGKNQYNDFEIEFISNEELKNVQF